MKQPKRYIKFTGKKCVMKPFENELGTIDIWEITESTINQKEFFVHGGQKYILVSSIKKTK